MATINPSLDYFITVFSEMQVPTPIYCIVFYNAVSDLKDWAYLNHYMDLEVLCKQCLSNINSGKAITTEDTDDDEEGTKKLKWFYERITTALYSLQRVYVTPTFPPYEEPEPN